MNTVFKVHENAWLISGLAAGVAVAMLGRRLARGRWPVLACAVVGLLAGLVYPVSAIQSRLAEPTSGLTLDGVAFLPADDAAAIRWLHEQTASSRPVIAEAVGDSPTNTGGDYSFAPAPAGRMSVYSGASSILGWAGHELQWRGPIPEIGQREQDVTQLYTAPLTSARVILANYAVDFVVVGDVERSRYGSQVDSQFEGSLPVAFRAGRTTIYRVH
jgi:uncharacterized membrane protein